MNKLTPQQKALLSIYHVLNFFALWLIGVLGFYIWVVQSTAQKYGMVIYPSRFTSSAEDIIFGVIFGAVPLVTLTLLILYPIYIYKRWNRPLTRKNLYWLAGLGTVFALEVGVAARLDAKEPPRIPTHEYTKTQLISRGHKITDVPPAANNAEAGERKYPTAMDYPKEFTAMVKTVTSRVVETPVYIGPSTPPINWSAHRREIEISPFYEIDPYQYPLFYRHKYLKTEMLDGQVCDVYEIVEPNSVMGGIGGPVTGHSWVSQKTNLPVLIVKDGIIRSLTNVTVGPKDPAFVAPDQAKIYDRATTRVVQFGNKHGDPWVIGSVTNNASSDYLRYVSVDILYYDAEGNFLGKTDAWTPDVAPGATETFRVIDSTGKVKNAANVVLKLKRPGEH
jgi:hypothetical protein